MQKYIVLIVVLSNLVPCLAGETPEPDLFICAVSPVGRGHCSDLDALKERLIFVEGLPFDLFAVRGSGLLGERWQEFFERFNELSSRLPRRLLLGTQPVGAEGWEVNHNAMWLKRIGVPHEKCRRMTREEWFDRLDTVRAPAMALVFGQLNRAGNPTPDKLARYARAFAEFCRGRHRRCFIWFSAIMFRKGRDNSAMGHAVYGATKDLVEKYVWMDGPPMVVMGEMNMEELLTAVLSVTPAQATVMQYNHNRKLPTSTPEGVLRYMEQCRSRGINAFCVLSPLETFSRPPWAEFYASFKTP